MSSKTKHTRGVKILLVDDHALFREGMHHIVCQLAEQVDVLDAGSFSEAMTIVGNNPDLVLLDLKMPDSFVQDTACH